MSKVKFKSHDPNAILEELWERICCLKEELDTIIAGGVSWALLGNATTPTNFLGTTNAQDLVIKTNNVERARVTSGGLVGVATSAPTTQLDVNGQIRIRGGVPGVGKVLTSDVNGLATWQTSVVLGAQNGNSLSGTNVVLGQDVNQVGDPAILTSDREVPMGGFNFGFRGIGKFGIGTNIPHTRFHLDLDGAIFGVPTTTFGSGIINAGNSYSLVTRDFTTNSDGGIENDFNLLVTGNTPSSRPQIEFSRARGTIPVPLILQSGDTIGVINGNGYDGTNMLSRTSISFMVDGVPTTGSMPTALVFKSGTSSTVERWRIASNGNTGFAVATPTAILHIKGGTATANTAPLKLDDGILMTVPENGAIEKTSTHFYITLGGIRYQLDQQLVSASNGLGLTSGDVHLGGSNISSVTNITVNSGSRLSFIGTSNSTAFGILQSIDSGVGTAILALQDNATGTAIAAQHGTSGGTAVKVSGIDGIGLSALDNGVGIGIDTSSRNGIPLRVVSNRESGNDVNTAISIIRNNGTAPTGAGGVGMGTQILFQLEDGTGGGGTIESAKIISSWTDVTAGAEKSNLDIAVRSNGVTSTRASIKSTGQLQLPVYGAGSLTAIPTYLLGVNASGNIVETSVGGSSIKPYTSANFADATTVNDASLNGKTYELFLNDLNRFIYNEVGNQEWDYIPGGGFQILIPGFDSTTNNYHFYLFLK